MLGVMLASMMAGGMAVDTVVTRPAVHGWEERVQRVEGLGSGRVVLASSHAQGLVTLVRDERAGHCLWHVELDRPAGHVSWKGGCPGHPASTQMQQAWGAELDETSVVYAITGTETTLEALWRVLFVLPQVEPTMACVPYRPTEVEGMARQGLGAWYRGWTFNPEAGVEMPEYVDVGVGFSSDQRAIDGDVWPGLMPRNGALVLSRLRFVVVDLGVEALADAPSNR